MKEGTSAQLSGRGELHGGPRVTTLVTLRKCTLGNKREIKTLKFVSASTKGFKGGLAWIKPSKKDMAVTFSYSLSPAVSLNLWSMKGSPMGTSFSSAPKRKPQYHEHELLPSKVTHRAATRTPKRGKKTPHRPLIQPAMRPQSLAPPQPFFSPSLWDFFQLRPPPEPPPSGVTVHT